MNKAEQKKFIKELISNVESDILDKSKKFPENWDGIELRWYIADKFNDAVLGGDDSRKGKRYKEFKNIVIVDNL